MNSPQSYPLFFSTSSPIPELQEKKQDTGIGDSKTDGQIDIITILSKISFLFQL